MSDMVYNAFDEEKADWMQETVNEILRKQMEYNERELVEIIEKYDFITGSIETKIKLMEILPGANVVYSPYVKPSTMVYAIEKFDIKDLLKTLYPYVKAIDYRSAVKMHVPQLSECPFSKPNGDCICKEFKNKYAPNYKDFGSMGDL